MDLILFLLIYIMENKSTEPKEEILSKINFIHEVKVYNELQNHKQILIFDLRSKESYINSHLHFAINIPYTDYDSTFFANFNEEVYSELTTNDEIKAMVKSFKRYYIVILISEDKIKRKDILYYFKLQEGQKKDMIRKGLLLYECLVDKKVREIGLYNMGFNKFSDHYYFIVNRNSLSPVAMYIEVDLRNISNFPSEIFDHKIYIGSQKHVRTSLF
jgi:hypothetical protein